MGKRISIHDLRRMKHKGEKIAMLTCYDYTSARIVDQVGIPIILVGDSLGMVMHGHDSTLRVTLDMMIHHSRSVSRGTTGAMVVVDLPFGSYSASDLPLSLGTARRAIAEGGATAVKIEGGRRMAPVVGTLVASGIPVMGHIGLTPQSIHMIGGYRVQGRGDEAGERLLAAAKTLEEAGAFAMVLECVPAKLAKRISEELTIPTIGIGAGPECDGQVQVWHDLMGLTQGMNPRHAKAYAQLADTIRGAAAAYLEDVTAGSFPGPEHSFDFDELMDR
ncbi:MAG: 3-methyl-2-oxobutanoate hydroxymethyltransferase [Planctomycetota bacterium]|jgi:3-methyl-2-oxobutanoate hydroxymethyltransferase|nr:3-methyl-2-oxobutanoate hydroxymethyltransferase [Planctomycetota bacterium]